MSYYNVPKRPIGTAPRDLWEQRVHDVLFKELQFNDSPTVKVNKNQNGYSFAASAGGSGGGTLQLYVITELFGGAGDEAFDYFGATPWSYQSNNTSGAQVLVAKCIDGRGPQTELIDGQAIFYNQYYYDNQRYSYNTASQAAEFQAMHKRYQAYPGFPPPTDDNGNPLPYQTLPFESLTIEQCFVMVAQAQGATLLDDNGNPILYYEASPNREWAYSVSLNGG